MCFRPADASAAAGPNKCPECGKTIQSMGGVVLKKCPFCKCDFTPYLDGTKPLPGAPAAAAPGAPGAPKPPGVPGAPKAPGAPRPPGAPGAPRPPGAPGAPGAPKPPTA